MDTLGGLAGMGRATIAFNYFHGRCCIRIHGNVIIDFSMAQIVWCFLNCTSGKLLQELQESICSSK
jgi:hypothetical protein